MYQVRPALEPRVPKPAVRSVDSMYREYLSKTTQEA
jgi:hypothetical protein